MNKNSSRRPDPAAHTKGLLRTFATSLLVLVTGLVVIFTATDRGHAFTTETLRRAEVAREPRTIPDLRLFDSDGKPMTLRQRLGDTQRIWIVDFVYTRCRTVCSSLGSVYQQLQRQIVARGIGAQVGLLSVSFDSANDDTVALHDYAIRMGLNPDLWDVVTLASASDRQRLLDAFGIMVLPAPGGEFEHNAALHIIDGKGMLVRIMDYGEPDRALDVAVALTR